MYVTIPIDSLWVLLTKSQSVVQFVQQSIDLHNHHTALKLTNDTEII